MIDYTKKLKQKGWKLKEVAELWHLTPRRLSQIASDPQPLHLAALEGLPSKNDDDPYNFDDFDELFAAGNPAEVSALILAAAIKHKWTDEQILNLSADLADMIRLAAASRRLNRSKNG